MVCGKTERSDLMLVSIFLSHRCAHLPMHFSFYFILIHAHTQWSLLSFVNVGGCPHLSALHWGGVTLQWAVLDSGSNPVAMSAVQSRPKSVPETDYGHLLSNPERRWCHEAMEQNPAWNHKRTQRLMMSENRN